MLEKIRSNMKALDDSSSSDCSSPEQILVEEDDNSDLENLPEISSSFNMEKIISENNKKLNRYGGFDKKQGEFEELMIEETEMDLPEMEHI